MNLFGLWISSFPYLRRMILVTGATGLLGSRLLHDLTISGKSVRALRRENSRMNCVNHHFGSAPELLSKINWLEGDITDIFSLEKALEGVTDVYHCAGRVSFQPGDQKQVHHVNARGTANLVNLCIEKNIRKFCHVSSIAAIGKSESEEFNDENTPWKSSKLNSSYAISKYAAEQEVWRAMAEGLNAVIVNPGLIIGPGNWKTDSSMIYRQVWNGLSFYTDGVNGLVDVADVTRSMINLMDSEIKNERFIVVGENMALKEMMDLISDALDKKRPSIHAGPMLTGIAWRIEYIKSLFSRLKPVITKETAQTAQNRNFYSSEKLKKATGIEFSDVRRAINRTAKIFMDEFAEKNSV